MVVAPLVALFGGDLGPSPVFATVSVLLGAALLLRDVDLRGVWCAEWLAAAAFGLTFLMAVAHVYGVTTLYAHSGHLMTVRTTFASSALSLGVLLLRADRGIARLLAATSREGQAARRLVGALLVLPVAFGWLRLRAQQAGLVEQGMGTALLAAFTAGTLVLVFLWGALSLERATAERNTATAERERIAARLQSMSDSGIVGITVATTSGRFIEANDAFLELIGYTRADLEAGLVHSKVITPADLHEGDAEAAMSLAGAGALPLREKEYLRKDGHRVPALVGGAVLGGEECVGVVVDISRQKQLEAALRAAERDLANTLDSVGDAIIVADTGGAVTRMNPVAQRLTGWAEGEAVGRALDEVLPMSSEASGQRIENPVTVILRDGPGVAFPTHSLLTARDGTVRSVSDSGAPVRDETGRIRGVVLVFRDTTDERRTERELAKSRTLFARLAEAGVFGIVLADSSANITEANDTFLRMVGYSREDLIAGRVRPADLTPADRLLAMEQQRASLNRSGSGITAPHEKEFLRKDGSRMHALVVFSRLDDGGVLGVVTDLTEMKKAESERARLDLKATEEATKRERAEAVVRQKEEQLRQAQKMEAVGQLAGGVAHDFNNILSIILSYSELVLREIAPGERIRGEIEEILRAAGRAADLTRQLLLFSRQQTLAPRVVDLNGLVTGMDKMLRRLVGEDVDLIAVLAASLAPVMVDPGSFEQVIMNLAVNARDAMPTGGKITIETANVTLDEAYAGEHLGAKPGPHVLLAVSDTGSGMDRATQERIFEPFFTTKPQGKGTGLGLSTTFGIVQQSGGTIQVYSELGMGTTFKVYLPAVAVAVEPRMTVAPAANTRATETILLVEDEEQVRAVARSILRRQGYHVIEAQNAGEALLLCEKHSGTIDILVSDVVMPQMSGPELARRLAAVRPTMKVLCMSGYTADAVVRHGVLEGGIAFLQKPFTPETLTAKVRQVLDAAAPSAAQPPRS